MRACLVAGELARRDGLAPVRLGEVYYSTLMRYAGCAATSHEAAASFGGDDIAVRARGDLIDTARPAEAVRFLAGLGTGVERLRVLARMPRVPGLVASGRAGRLRGGRRADHAARPALGGHGIRAVRLRAVRREGRAGRAVGGRAAGAGSLRRGRPRRRHVRRRRWAGSRRREPHPVVRACPGPADHRQSSSTRRRELLELSDPEDLWATVVAAEPEPQRFFRDDDHLDEVLAGFGDAADLKAPFFQGHSRGVALLARAAAARAPGHRAEAGLPRRARPRPRPGRRPHGRLGAAPGAAARGMGAGAPAPLPLGPDPVAVAGRWRRSPRS